MNKERMVALTDAVLAIVMTILVLELPQPESATWHAIWAERAGYAAYFTSFFGTIVLWNNHHHIFQVVHRIDGRVLWANDAMIFSATLFPYATKFVESYFTSWVAEFVYWLVFVVYSICYLWVYHELVRADPKNQELRRATKFGLKVYSDWGVKIVGLVLSFWYPPFLIISTFVAMLLWAVPERTVEIKYRDVNRTN